MKVIREMTPKGKIAFTTLRKLSVLKPQRLATSGFRLLWKITYPDQNIIAAKMNGSRQSNQSMQMYFPITVMVTAANSKIKVLLGVDLVSISKREWNN